MAKKSSKSTRKSRAKKEAPSKKTAAAKKQAVKPEPVVIAEGSDEPVAKADKPAAKKAQKAPAKKSAKKPAAKAAEPVAVVATSQQQAEADVPVDEVLPPPFHRMVVSAIALGVVVIALVVGAAIMRQQNQTPAETAKSGQGSAQADQILTNGGKVCTNQQAIGDTSGSTNPQSVGMTLQNNPTNTIQTPQTMGGGGSDAMALQGAACY